MGQGTRKSGSKNRAGTASSGSLSLLGTPGTFAAAVATFAAAAAYFSIGGLLTPAQHFAPAEWQSLAPECIFGKDFDTMAELMERRTPCLVRGLGTPKIAEVTRLWSPSTILRLPHARGQVLPAATYEPLT